MRSWIWLGRLLLGAVRWLARGLFAVLAVGVALYGVLGPGVIELPPGVGRGHVLALALLLAGVALWGRRRRRRQRRVVEASQAAAAVRASWRDRGVRALLLLATLLLIEFALRGVLGNYAISKLQAPGDNCSLRAGQVSYTGWFLRIPPVRHSVNGFGYRGAARPPSRPRQPEQDEGPLRVLLVGDSSTFGQGVPDDATIAAQLERQLDQALDGLPAVEVLNFGVEGLNVEDVLTRYVFASQWEHDAVLYLLNRNDLAGSSCDATPWAPDLFREVYVLRVPLMATFAALALLEAATAGEPDREAADRRLLAGIDALAQAAVHNGARFGLVVLGSPDRSSGRWAERVGVPLLDVSHVSEDPANVIPNEFHFNERGGGLVAEAIAGWLPRLLAVEAGG